MARNPSELNIKQLVKERLKIFPHGMYDPRVQIRNPFSMSDVVYDAAGNLIGSVQTCSKEMFAPYHWALVNRDRIVFDFQLGRTYRLHSATASQSTHERRTEKVRIQLPLIPSVNFDTQPPRHNAKPRVFLGNRVFYIPKRDNKPREYMGAINLIKHSVNFAEVFTVETTSGQKFLNNELLTDRFNIGCRAAKDALTPA